MTRALAEVGRPESARDVLDGGDVGPATGRLLSVGELQAALRATMRSALPPVHESSSELHQRHAVTVPPSSPVVPAETGASAPAQVLPAAQAPSRLCSRPTRHLGPGRLRPPPGRRWVAVVGAHGGAGTSTVALALADAAAAGGSLVHLVSCNPPADCGLLGAASVELGVDVANAWRTGRRGQRITLDRPVEQAEGRWPAAPVGGGPGGSVLTVVDAEVGAARVPRLLASAAAVLLVCRASVRGVQQAEQLLGPLLHLDRDEPGALLAVAVLGSGRWPRAVRGATGPLVRRLQADSLVVAVPLDRQLSTYGPTGAALPRPVQRVGVDLLRLLTAAGALAKRTNAAAAAVHQPAAAQPAPPPLLVE